MHVVLFIISMRQFLHKKICLRSLCILFCEFSKHRCADPDDRFFVDSRKQPAVKISVFQILHLKQFFFQIFYKTHNLILPLFLLKQKYSADSVLL